MSHISGLPKASEELYITRELPERKWHTILTADMVVNYGPAQPVYFVRLHFNIFYTII